jgi:hypothetical protein
MAPVPAMPPGCCPIRLPSCGAGEPIGPPIVGGMSPAAVPGAIEDGLPWPISWSSICMS